MDGASKFVRGDAIAGLLIVGINIVGGIIIAVAQKGMSFSDASQTFTLLSVGDGLVSQMPALIVSTAAGLMVSKAGVEGATDKALMSQLSFYPQALAMVAAVMGIVAVLPGMPTIVFGSLAGAFGALAYYAFKRRDARAAEVKAEAATAAGPAKEESIASALALDLLRVELGYGLLPLINDVQGHRITDQIKALRRQLAQEMGFVMPAVPHPGTICNWAPTNTASRSRKWIRARANCSPAASSSWTPRSAHRPARHPHHRAGLRPARHLGVVGRCARKPASAALPWSIPAPC